VKGIRKYNYQKGPVPYAQDSTAGPSTKEYVAGRNSISSRIQQCTHSVIFFRSVNQHIALGMYKSRKFWNLQL
jgi:hypothetical protein